MTAPATEKTAPLPAGVLAKQYAAKARVGAWTIEETVRNAILADRASQEDRYATFVNEPQATYTHAEVEALLNEVSNRFRKAHLEHVLRDRASQEERIREDEREACAKVAEQRAVNGGTVVNGDAIAHRIRLRGDAS